VLLELSAREQRVLDAFEGEEYASASVEVVLEVRQDDGTSRRNTTDAAQDGSPLRTQVYMFLQPAALLLQSEWSYEHWRRTHLVVRLGCARRTPLTAL
jgi:hypothetical protein